MTAFTSDKPAKTRPKFRWLPDRFELFEVAVLIAASHVLAFGTMLWGWGNDGFWWGALWIIACFLVYALSLTVAQAMFRLRFGGHRDDPYSVLAFAVLPVANMCLLGVLYLMEGNTFMVGSAMAFYCWSLVFPFPSGHNFLQRDHPDSGLGEDPLKRENRREPPVRW